MMMVDRSKVGKRSKNKGNARERWVAKALSKWWGETFKKTPQSGGSQLAEEWRLAGDVATRDDEWPFHVEVKNRENWQLVNFFTSDKCQPWKWWLESTLAKCPDDDQPLMVFKRNRSPAWVMMFDEFFRECMDVMPPNYLCLIDPEGNEVIVFEFEYLLSTETHKWRVK